LRTNVLFLFILAAGRTYVLIGPGAIVKKITNEKSVDKFPKFCYTIIVKRKGKKIKKVKGM
jgi:hypothetical protein